MYSADIFRLADADLVRVAVHDAEVEGEDGQHGAGRKVSQIQTGMPSQRMSRKKKKVRARLRCRKRDRRCFLAALRAALQ